MRYISLIGSSFRAIGRIVMASTKWTMLLWRISHTQKYGIGLISVLGLILGLWMLPMVTAQTREGTMVEQPVDRSFYYSESMFELPEIPTSESIESMDLSRETTSENLVLPEIESVANASSRVAPADVILTKRFTSDKTELRTAGESSSSISATVVADPSFKRLSMWATIASETPPRETVDRSAVDDETMRSTATSASLAESVQDEPNVPVTSKSASTASATHYWVLSTRSTRPQWFYRDTKGRFTQADRDQFLESADETTPIVIFVHGNQASFARSVQMGDMIYDYLQQQNPGARFLLWSWDSERECPFIRIDTSIKSARADAQAIPLAALLSAIPPKTPVILVGYSFGCRVVGGAMQLCGGGPWKGESATTVADATEMSDETNGTASTATQCNIRATILVAAAMDQNSFRPTGAMNTALKQVEYSIVTTHAWDNALSLYHLISESANPAMGLMGPDAVAATDAEHIRTCDLSNEILPIHAWENYFSSVTLRCLLTKAVRGDVMISTSIADESSTNTASE